MKKLKILISSILWGGYFVSCKLFYPLSINTQAVTQFEDTNSSYTNLKIVESLWDYGWIIILILTLLIFKNDIKNIINKIKFNQKEGK